MGPEGGPNAESTPVAEAGSGATDEKKRFRGLRKATAVTTMGWIASRPIVVRFTRRSRPVYSRAKQKTAATMAPTPR